ncbi:DUF1203 domain-containing protein [Palleronia sp.]|uniref:DUF1203 domain-containing protein n=1 Tax=Palleronia sp. TaxID=1940284 RepID=UPI0035C7BD7A
MTFQIVALPYAPFASLFTRPETELARYRARRLMADSRPGYPCRVSLSDAEIGETLILVNYTHLGGATPYAANHAIYVRSGAARACPKPGEVPDMLTSRLLSVRGFDADGLLQHAEVKEGAALAPVLEDVLSDTGIAHADIHFAGPGCFGARAMRVA